MQSAEYFLVIKMYQGITFWEHNPLLKHGTDRAMENFTCSRNDTIRIFLDFYVDYQYTMNYRWTDNRTETKKSMSVTS